MPSFWDLLPASGWPVQPFFAPIEPTLSSGAEPDDRIALGPHHVERTRYATILLPPGETELSDEKAKALSSIFRIERNPYQTRR